MQTTLKSIKLISVLVVHPNREHILKRTHSIVMRVLISVLVVHPNRALDKLPHAATLTSHA